MTPLAKTVGEEGVLFDNFLLARDGTFREEALRDLLTDHPLSGAQPPTRTSPTLKAQVAANERGAAEFAAHGGGVRAGKRSRPTWAMCRTTPAEEVARLIGRLGGLFLRISDRHRPGDPREDHGGPRGARSHGGFHRDERGRTDNNFNAPEPVTRAAVLYCFRVMVEAPIPMNARVACRPIRIVIPEGSMLKPAYPRAVVAGNVETVAACDQRPFLVRWGCWPMRKAR